MQNLYSTIMLLYWAFLRFSNNGVSSLNDLVQIKIVTVYWKMLNVVFKTKLD